MAQVKLTEHGKMVAERLKERKKERLRLADESNMMTDEAWYAHYLSDENIINNLKQVEADKDGHKIINQLGLDKVVEAENLEALRTQLEER